MAIDLPLNDGPVLTVLDELGAAFDQELGGFGCGAKQTGWPFLELLLATYGRRADRDALHMACVTLRRMALGGIHDQIAGGFWRASRDRWWMIPEFNKPLYDNARLLDLYTSAWLATGDDFFGRISQFTGRWMLRDLIDPVSGLLARAQGDAELADDRAHFLWSPETVRTVLDDDASALVIRRFGLDDEPNFGQSWHLHVYAALSELAAEMRRPRSELLALLERANGSLLAARQQRPLPSLDRTRDMRANAGAVAAMARAGRRLEIPELTAGARRIWSAMNAVQEADASAASLAHALVAGLELLKTDWEADTLLWLHDIASRLLTAAPSAPIAECSDRDATDEQDAATRIQALNSWGALAGNADALDAAERTLRSWWPAVEADPSSHPRLLQALDSHLHTPLLVLIEGDAADERARWLSLLERSYDPNLQCYSIPTTAIATLRSGSSMTGKQTGATRAWLCRGTRCLAVIDSLTALRETLGNR